MTKTERILEIIQQVADEFQVFQSRGPGEGNRVTNQAVAALNDRVTQEIGRNAVNQALCSGVNQSVDFFIEGEETVIEVEFSLSNPYPCLEKDAFKVLLAKAEGRRIKNLVLAGDPGSEKRLSAPAPRAIADWLRRNHDITVRVVELSDSRNMQPAKM